MGQGKGGRACLHSELEGLVGQSNYKLNDHLTVVTRGLSSAGAIKVPQGQLRNRLHGVVQDLPKPLFGENRHVDMDL